MPIIKNKWIKGLLASLIRRFINRFMRSPVEAAHMEYSMVYSNHDNPGKATKELIDLALEVIQKARIQDLKFISERTDLSYPDPTEFPGEHYNLLAGFVAILKPKVIIEIGTERGVSCLAMKSTLSVSSVIHTFDIKSWDEMDHRILMDEDFDASLVQHVVDLTLVENQEKFRELFEQADFIFMDAAKDGTMERVFLKYFDSINFRNKPVLMIDDIHNWNMLAIWREISNPKLDITSFGHFTGTGIVQL